MAKVLEQGSLLDNDMLPVYGMDVWAVVGFEQKVVKGTVTLVTNIDNRGLGNTYVDIDVNGKRWHTPVNTLYSHRPHLVEVTDCYGTTKVWR